MGCCVVCMDEEEEVVFTCQTRRCTYEMCAPCIKLAFKDAGGNNARTCPSCKSPTARRLIESICGVGAVKEVERELRASVEFEVMKYKTKQENNKKLMTKSKLKAQTLYQDLAEKLNLRCPRCSSVFYDYEGCNALTCWNSACRAAICAVCLMDCGRDAHDHVLNQHGTLFDKSAFEKAKNQREGEIFMAFMNEIVDESYEVKELVKIEYEKAKSIGTTSQNALRTSNFLQSVKASLSKAVRGDRLSLLSNDEGTIPRSGLGTSDVSPRNAIPEDYRLSLRSTGRDSVCDIVLEERGIYGDWEEIPLPDDEADDPPRDDRKGKPKVDSISNLKSSLQCAVIAFRGCRQLYQSITVPPPKKDEKFDKNTISIELRPISKAGDIGDERRSVNEITLANGGSLSIVGLNPNRRLMQLEKHVTKADDDQLLFPALEAFVGCTAPKRVVDEIPVPAPETFNDLNLQQKRVAHPLSLTNAMEVAGPPGTGKTKTITELVRGLLECTELDVIVLSERNGAIDAIASKMAEDCLVGELSDKKHLPKVLDVKIWSHILAFGSQGSIGNSTRLFTVKAKMKYHPELVQLRNNILEKRSDLEKLGNRILATLGNAVADLQGDLPDGADAQEQAILIKSGKEAGLSSLHPLGILHEVSEIEKAIGIVLSNGSQVREIDIENLVLDHSAILKHLLPLRNQEVPAAVSMNQRGKLSQFLRAISTISSVFKTLLLKPDFSVQAAEGALCSLRISESSLKAAETRIETELVEDARVMLCTIGSSHRLPVENPDKEEDDSLSDTFEQMSLLGKKRTVVIFDEAGCIPSYEFLGLSRLGRSIESLVCVGDKHQLRPYSPSTDCKTNARYRNDGQLGVSQRRVESTKVDSLLDASKLTVDDAKVKLTMQYRVPRDIADLLNTHIYRGDYETASECQAPIRGFDFVHFPSSARHRADSNKYKYINYQETDKCVELIESLTRQSQKSIMVLTPYKKQQRQIQFILEREGLERIPVLTIDQCQGQEADFVIFSLVQKPTRFLNKNRLNVALSRVRKKLYLLVDRNEFQAASRDTRWECALLAQDLLRMTSTTEDEEDEEDDEKSGFW